jgi:SdrD B-like domain
MKTQSMPVGWSLAGRWSGLQAAMMMLLLLLGVRSGEARAALMTQSYTTAIQFTDWTNSVTFPQFDTALGNLVAVRFQIVGTARSISRVENLGTVAVPGVISGAQVDSVVKDAFGTPLVSMTQFVRFTNNLAAYDGLSDYGGSSGVSNARRTVTGSQINAVLPPYTPYEGLGSYTLDVEAVGTGFCIGPANYLLQVRPELGATVTVYYDYEESIIPTLIGDLVWNDYNANGVLEPGEPGLAGVTVSLLDEFGSPVAGFLPTVTDLNGYYAFSGVPPGNYYVVVEAPVGFTPTYDLDGVDGSFSAFVSLASGEIQDDVDFGFAQLTSTVGDRVWIDVNGDGIQDLDEIGLAGVTVVLLDESGTELTSTVTDINGTYGFAGLNPGLYTVVVTNVPAGYVQSFDADGIGTADLTAVFLGTGEVWDIIDFGYQPRTSGLGDFVWQDRNLDGVQDVGEPGLAGVTVELRSAVDTSLLATTLTDANGAYSFTGLAAGNYLVVVLAPAGYLPTYDLDGTGTASQAQVTLGVDEIRDDVDFGYSGGRLGDRVWVDADADGVQDLGETGLAGATVSLSTGQSTTTDSNGYYSFADLPAGTYTVTVAVPPGWVATYDLDGVGTVGTAVVTLAAGEVTDTVDFGYQEQTASLGDRVWRDDDGDGVQDSGEVGLAGVTVELRDATGATVIATVVSDSNGFYEFENLAAGTYVVTAIQPASHVPTFDVDGLTVPNHAVVVVAGSEARNDVDFGYQPLGTIGNLVWLDLDENGAYQPGVEPELVGVVVTISGTGGTFSTTTDSLGLYTFPNLPPGTYTVAVTPIPGLDPSYDWDGTATPDTAVVVLGPGEVNLGVDFGYSIGSNLSDAQVGDRVWLDVDNNGVQDSGEAGISGLTVLLKDGFGTVIDFRTTDGNGEFLFSGLPADTYTVVVTGMSGYIPTYDADGIISANTATVTLANGEQRFDVDFGYRLPPPPPASVAGRVWDDADANGVPNGAETGLAGLPVTLWNSSGTALLTVPTDALGYYSFTGLVAGTYAVTVAPASYWGATFDVDGTGTPNIAGVAMVAGQSLTGVDFGYQYAPPPGSLGDRVWHDLNGDGVQDPGEPGLAGVTVELRDAGGALLASVPTDAAGFYGFLTVDAGDYTISILPPTYYDATGDVDGSASPNVTALTLGIGEEFENIDFGLIYNPPPALIGDRVWEDLNSNGVQEPGENGFPGLAVVLRDSLGAVVATATTGPAGEYAFGDLAAGTYSVTVTPPTYYIPTYDLDGIATTNVVTLTVAIGETNELVDFGLIYAPPLGSLGDRVWIDANSNSLQDVGELGMTNIPVTLKDSGGVVLATTTTDAAGEYRFTGLSARTYIVEVSVPTNAVPTFDADGAGTAHVATVALAIGEDRTDVDFGYFIPAAPLLGKIGNRVWIDANENGAQDVGEVGLTNAVVTLHNGLGTLVGTVTVGATGTYEFTGLEADTYTVTVSPPADYTATFDLDGLSTLNSAEVFLAAGDERDDVDFGYVYVPPDPMTGRVGDRVWSDVNGNGLAEISEPGLTNLVVELRSSGGTLLAVTTTTNNGAYLFTGLAAGSYSVRVFPPSGFTPTTDADGTSTPNVAAVTLAPGEERLDIDFGYCPPAPATIGDRVWIDRNSNGVQESSEVGLTNIVVVLRNGFGTPIGTNLTGANGRYLFTNLTAGTYTVVVTPPANYGPTFDRDGTSTPNRATVTVVTGEQRLNVDFGYVFCPGTGRIGDLVWIDSDADGTRDNDGCRGSESGLPNATVRLFDVNGSLIGTDVTDCNGRYEFTGLFAGTYSVVVTPPSGYTATYDLDGLLTLNRASVTLANGQTRNDVDFGYTRYTPRHTSGTGCTIGFWRNNNGLSLIRPYDFAVLTSLRLVNDNGSDRNFTSNLASNKSAWSSWLQSSTSSNMSRMLSAQLAAFQLNVLHGFYEATDVIPTPSIGTGSMTAQQLINAANAALTADGFTPTGDPNRLSQERLKNALDAANIAAQR